MDVKNDGDTMPKLCFKTFLRIHLELKTTLDMFIFLLGHLQLRVYKQTTLNTYNSFNFFLNKMELILFLNYKSIQNDYSDGRHFTLFNI